MYICVVMLGKEISWLIFAWLDLAVNVINQTTIHNATPLRTLRYERVEENGDHTVIVVGSIS